MKRSNLAVRFDANVIQRGRHAAAKRGMTVDALVARQLTDLIEDDDRIEAAHARAREVLSAAAARGGRRWTRDEIENSFLDR